MFNKCCLSSVLGAFWSRRMSCPRLGGDDVSEVGREESLEESLLRTAILGSLLQSKRKRKGKGEVLVHTNLNGGQLKLLMNNIYNSKS